MSSILEIVTCGDVTMGWEPVEAELAPLPEALAPEFEPTSEDLAWWAAASEEPSPRDWDELALLAEWQYRLEQMHMITDEDIMAAGLPVG